METITLRVPPELKKALQKLAAESETTPGHIARLLLSRSLERAISSGDRVFALPDQLTTT